MNRFDTFTIWNSDSEKLSDETENDPFPANDLLDTSAAPTSGESATEAVSPDAGEAEFGGVPSSWSSAIRAQTFFLPLHYEQNYRYPLIVWLHSDGFNENQVCHVMPHLSVRNYLATGIRGPMAADATGHRFGWSDSAAALYSAEQSVLEAINRAAAEYSVHAHRIVLAGYQRGGTMATRIAMQHPELFSAAISLGGRFDLPEIDQAGRERLRSRRLPMLWQRSMQSPQYCETRLVSEIRSARTIGAQLEVRQYRNDDEMNTVVLRDLDRWIMEHVVSGSPVVKMNQWDSSPTSFSDN